MEIKYPEIYDESYKILKSVYGDDANFRDGQYEASWSNKVLTITFTNCNYVNIFVGGSNVTYV